MEKVGYGKWAIWMAITVLLSLLADNVIAQSGFLSVDCAGKENYTDENKISWVTDANYIDVGETAVTGNATLPSYLQRLRFFPKPLNKSCYRLPVSPNVPFLLRLWFSLGNYSGFSGSYPNFNYSIETSGLLIYSPMPDSIPDPYFNHEGIYVSSGEVLYVCLIRSRDADDPFINAIELRTLQNGMYSQAKSDRMLFKSGRADLGGNSIVRYPRDNFDRIWKPYRDLTNSSTVRNVSSKEPIFSDSTKNHPPTAVMQTAWVMNIDDFRFTLPTAPWAKSLLLLYIAELETLNTSESTSFYVTINGEYRSETIWLVRNYSALELTFISNEATEFIFHLVKAPRSTNRPIINAFEHYTIHHTWTATNSQDIEALGAIKSKYGIKGWISDPCFMIPWNGLGCAYSSKANKISEINLSGRNLTGSVPEEIGQLTALVNVSLENNNLIGPLPDLSGLTMLERLHLQNNSLNGSLPDWLFNLNNLKELFIQNNNFSGVIRGELLDKNSLNVKFTGNNYLCIYKAGECVQQIQETGSNSKRVNLGIILGITISGGLIALAMGAIAVYRRKLRKRQRHNKDDTIEVPQLEKYPRLTYKDMEEATENFSRKIGEGNSGKVFYGKLRDERVVAVKRFSTFQQFLNEADVLSKAQNKNLMPLHGYCNELKNPMLIYEHMSGGSLSDKLHGKDVSDKLHGAVAGDSNLDWKTRLNIALNVAQGLEFMHAGCTPKIIHRDVKTANILLDNNMNAKLADFGISRIAKDGEASHATTSMAKGTPGYIDPEYRRTNKVTEKSDVYSFGVVLFEMICGRKAANESLLEEEFNLVNWVTPYVKDVKAGPKIIDERLAGNYNLESIDRVAKLALRCVDDTPRLRPSMTDVVGEIKDAITLEKENNAQSEDMGWVDDSSEVRPLT